MNIFKCNLAPKQFAQPTSSAFELEQSKLNASSGRTAFKKKNDKNNTIVH